MPWLLEVEVVMLDSLTSAVLPLDSVAGHVVPVCPCLCLLNAG